MMNITVERQNDLIMSATAYYLGRRTIQTCDHIQWLFENWDEFDEHVRKFVQRIVDDAIRRQRSMLSAGPLRVGSAIVLPLGEKPEADMWVLLSGKWKQ